MSLIEQLKEEQKNAMRNKEKLRLGTIRMTLAAVNQKEIDEQITVDDAQVLAIITKMVKQRKDAAQQYLDAARQDLADQELAEIDVLETFLPQPLTADEIAALIDQAIATSGATGMQDMGKVMGILKPQVAGRADMGQLSGKIKARLN